MSKDKLREKIEKIVSHQFDLVTSLTQEGYLDSLKRIADQTIALFPDNEELEKQVRQLKQSDFAEIPGASDFRKVQLDGGQFVYEKVLRLIRKMEGK